MGATVYKKEQDIYLLKNCGYNSKINPGENVKLSFIVETSEEIVVPKSFKIPVSFQEVPEKNYSLVINKVSDYETKIDITNISNETIYGWRLEFETDMEIYSTNIGILTYSYGLTNIQSEEYNYELLPKETVSISLYTGKIPNRENFESIKLFENKIIDLNKYQNIAFTSEIDIEATGNYINSLYNNTTLLEKESISMNIASIVPIGLEDSYDYNGTVTFVHDNNIITEKISGTLKICNEGLYGTFHGFIDNIPLTLTLNYAFQNEQPYVFLAVGSLNTDTDYYKVYGERQESNDIISEEIIELRKEINIKKEIPTNDELMENESVQFVSRAVTDYDTYPRNYQYCYFKYDDLSYYLGAISIYTPIKTKANCTYAVYAKVNTQDNNAMYYLQKVKKMPGSILSFSSKADVCIYTQSNSVDFISADPESIGGSTSTGISVAIPVLNYLSFDILSLNIPNKSVVRTLGKINNSAYRNYCSWEFNKSIDADLGTKDAYATETGYAGYVVMSNLKNTTHNYTVVAEGVIYYEMTTRLVNYVYDGAFNVELYTSQTITNYPNN